MKRITQKLPTRAQAIPVFSTILFIVFSWMFFQFFIQVPSWLFYMNATKLLVMFSYVVSFSLLESLVLMGVIIFLCLVFPARHFKDKFIPQGTAQVILISLITYFVRQKIELFEKFEVWQLLTVPLIYVSNIVLSIFIFSLLFDRFSSARRLFNLVADRMTIFAYLYLPIGLAGLVVVLIRNIT
jgi:hypothetical protein